MKFFSLIVLILITSISVAENTKIGYVDVDLVINSLTKYKEDTDAIILNFQPKKLELLDLFDHIEKLKINLNLTKSSLSSEEYKKQIEIILKLENSFQNETDQWQAAINQQKAISLEQIETLINKAVRDLANIENYDLIFYSNAAYVAEELNISNQIISAIESLN
ncbi:OmpH family outer membrane protein [Candidatus Pseudothioglobus singularis]|jgi:outer membrane protein|nr:OmpH family outer membrane protein [Candidatus Pseudothioglobus singularis]